MRWIHLSLFLCMLYGGIQLSVAKSNTTCDPTQFSCKNGRCINIAWKCDGDNDCNDHSDEAKCPATTCSDNFFRCDDGKCIPERWVCDDNDDCKDSSDEKQELCRSQICLGHRCKNSTKCIANSWKCDGHSDCPEKDDEEACNNVCDPATQFTCDDSNCITATWKCDGRKDCADGSDENDCPQNDGCSVGEKMCNDKECMNEFYWCDGDADCSDKSDEVNCTNTLSDQTCGPKEFQCQHPLLDVQCIHIEWKCDGDDDCSDGSDEANCGHHSCSSDERMCDNNVCMKAAYFCDGDDDCDAGEDEKNCNQTAAPPSRCSVHEFDCGSMCISETLICNGVNDCGNGADEAPERHCPLGINNTCTKDNGGCNQVCIPDTNESSGRRCECYPGYELITDTECVDIDECKIIGACSQKCYNTKGSYKCECFTGYTLTNHRYCKASYGSHPELILSDHHGIRRYHLETYHFSFLLQQKVDGAVAMDFDIRNKTLYWTDVRLGKVFSASLETNETNAIIEDKIDMPDGLAVDWIHGNLYLADTGLDKIEVARLDGSNRKTLVHENLDEPRALALDPSSGWMYWTDWGSQPKIEKCGMNGKERKAIVTSGITWPNGLTIDYTQNRLYWVDAKLHSIGSTDMDGNNFKLVLKNHRNLGHPFAITVFEDYLYWTDWVSNAVHKISKFGRGNVSTVAQGLRDPMDLHVYHIIRQPASSSNCVDNGGCSHLCLPVPRVKTISQIPKLSECACPDNMILYDEFNCKQSSVTDTPKKVQPQTSDDSSPNRPNRPDRPKATVTEPTVKYATDNVPQTSSDKVIVEESYVNKTHVKIGYNDNEGAGYIAGIAIGSLLFIGLAASMVAYLLLKRHKSRNVKSMNFDNPVYRKTTTEDHLTMEKKGSRSNLPQSLQPLNQEHDIV